MLRNFASPKMLRDLPNGDLQKTFSTSYYISRPNGLKQNIVTADTVMAEPGP